MYEEYLNHFNFYVGTDIKKFTEEILKNKEYLFVRNDKEQDYITSFARKVQYGYCSHCKKEFKLEGNISHNEVGICECGAELQAKEVRYGKKKLMNEACFYWFGKSILDPNVVTCKGYYVSKKYDKDYKNPDYDFSLQAIYVFDTSTKESNMLIKNDWYNYGWDKRASIFDFNQGWLANKFCHCSFDSLDIAVKETVFQYSNYKDHCRTSSIIKYLGKFNKYPWVEQLVKIGFGRIADAFILEKEFLYNCLNYKGKDIFKKLRLNKAEVKNIINSNVEITPELLKLYQLDKKHNSKTNILEIEKFNNNYGWNYAEVDTVLQLTNINKAMSYIEKQFKLFNEDCYNSKGNVLTTWRDYIEDCKKLCRDINNKDILFPKDLHKVHQDTIKLVKVEGDKRFDKKIEKRIEKLKDMYLFKDKNFFIRPAESSQDLIKEGDTLKHCVAKNYSMHYANGKTDILFLRRINSPNDPLVTIEVKDGRIMQAHGKNNKQPKEEEQNFIEKFKNEILSKLNSKKGKVA